MSESKQSSPRSELHEDAIKRHIERRTGGRIQGLDVELIDDCVVISGAVPCYYLKQLVLQCVLDQIGSGSATRIELNVQVVCGERAAVQRPGSCS